MDTYEQEVARNRRARMDSNWRALYINAIAKLAGADPEQRGVLYRKRLTRFIVDRIAMQAWRMGCEWQVRWGDPSTPMKVHPRLDSVPEDHAPTDAIVGN